ACEEAGRAPHGGFVAVKRPRYVISLHARWVPICYLAWSTGFAADERRPRLPQDGGRVRGHCQPHVASLRPRTADANGRTLVAPGGRCGRTKRCWREGRQVRNSAATMAALTVVPLVAP